MQEANEVTPRAATSMASATQRRAVRGFTKISQGGSVFCHSIVVVFFCLLRRACLSHLMRWCSVVRHHRQSSLCSTRSDAVGCMYAYAISLVLYEGTCPQMFTASARSPSCLDRRRSEKKEKRSSPYPRPIFVPSPYPCTSRPPASCFKCTPEISSVVGPQTEATHSSRHHNLCAVTRITTDRVPPLTRGANVDHRPLKRHPKTPRPFTRISSSSGFKLQHT